MTDFAPILQELDRWQAAGRTADLWVRDDDAVIPTTALDRLLDLGAGHDVPLTLAVIPQNTGADLANRLAGAGRVEVAVHGWSHTNHAPAGQKSRELGGDRAAAVVLADLTRGLVKLQDLHGPRTVPLLVPPWNRIDAGLVPKLPGAGYRGLSVFGPEPTAAPLRMLNTHVDVIDWRGHRGGRDGGVLVAEIVARLQHTAITGGSVGLLTHHLVHDAAVWAFLDGLFAATAHHPGGRWCAASDLLAVDPPPQTSVT